MANYKNEKEKNKRIERLSKREEALRAEIAELDRISTREKVDDKFSELYFNKDLPPYELAAFTFMGITEDAFYDGTREFEPNDYSSSGRERTKAEKVIIKGLYKGAGGIYIGSSCVLAGMATVGVAALTTPIEIPRLAGIGVETIINKCYNNHTKKAKSKVVEKRAELDSVLKELNELKGLSEEKGMEQ